MTSPVEPPQSRYVLPDPASAGPDDVIAIGGDLQPGTLLQAYRRGMFPMNLPDGALAWWSPWQRGVLPLDGLHVSRSLRRSLTRFQVTIDVDFEAVIAGCADPGRPHGWITDEIRHAYTVLHRLGWAHSIEVWDEHGRLAGGLYGVGVGGMFAGESMFHHQTDASKVAVVHLVQTMRNNGGALVDVQWATPHLQTLGVIEISRHEYLDRVATALEIDASSVWPSDGPHEDGR